MADERYYKVSATFDPTIIATLAMPWTPASAAGDDPGNMRARTLVEPRVGRFPPDVLGRRNKQTTSLVWVWTDGPILQGAAAYVLGSDTESAPPSVQRTPAYPLTLGSDSAQVLELGPSDHLAITTAGQDTTCYIRVLDLDEAEMVEWLSNKKAKECCTPTFTRVDISNVVVDAVHDIPTLDVDQIEVRIAATVPTVLRLPAWANARPNQVINIVRDAALSDGLVAVSAVVGDTVDVFGGAAYVPLNGTLRVQRGAGVGNWDVTEYASPSAATQAVGDKTFLQGWAGSRFLRLTAAGAQTVTMPTYGGLTIPLPLSQRLVLTNASAVAKTLTATAGELIVGLGVSNISHTIPAQTTVIVDFNGTTYTIV